MKLEILLATIHQTDDTVLDTMGVASDILVCNQNAKTTAYRQYKKRDYNVRWYDFQEKGVGLNRNSALLRATGDICLLADVDVEYVNDYEKIILDAFEKYPWADIILFNMRSGEGKFKLEKNKIQRIHLHNCGKYGAEQLAFRRMSVIKNAISFNQLFGGGCMFSAGEDTMFIRNCIRKGLRVIAVPECILRLTECRPSTWFHGYTEKFFFDRGVLFAFLYGKFAWLWALRFVITKKEMFQGKIGRKKAYRLVREGIRQGRLEKKKGV